MEFQAEKPPGHSAHLQALRTLNGILHQPLGFESAVLRIRQLLPDCLGVSRIALLIAESRPDGTRMLRTADPHERTQTNDAQALDFSISGAAFTRDEAVVVNDCRNTDLIPSCFVDSLQLKSSVALPLRAGGDLIGVLRLDDTENYGRFPSEEVEFLQVVAELVALVLANARLVDSQKQVFEALESERNFATTIIESVRTLVVVLDHEGRVVRFNRACEELTGFDSTELVGHYLWDVLMVGKETDPISSYLGEVQSGQTPARSYEGTWLTKSGQRRLISWSYRTLRAPDGQLQYVIASGTDVTERRRAERERDVFTRLGLGLAVAGTVHDIGVALRRSTEELWNWDSFYLTVRRSGKVLMRSVLEVDLIDGEKREIVAEGYEPGSHLGKGPLTRGEAVLVNRDLGDPGTMSRFGDTARPSASLLYAPIRVGDEVIGVCSIQSYTPYLFNEEDRDLLFKMADAAGPALARCQAEQRSDAFLSLGHRLSAARTPEEASESVLEVADELLGWDACFVNLYLQSEHAVHPLVNMDTVDGVRQKVSHRSGKLPPTSCSWRAMQEGAFLVLRRQGDSGFTAARPFGDTNRPSASLMYVPIRGPLAPIGVLSIQSYHYDAYDEKDLSILQALADHCAGALERTLAEEALRTREERYRSIITGAGAVPYQLDYPTDSYVFIGDGIRNMTGYSADEFTPDLLKEIRREVDLRGECDDLMFEEAEHLAKQGKIKQWLADYRVETRSGETRWLSDSAVVLYDSQSQVIGSLGILQDITERKAAEEQLLHGAYHDALTGLPNRAHFMETLTRVLAHARRRTGYRFAVLFLDLDRFKVVNDSLGHLVGDRLLVAIAHRLLSYMRPGDMVARLGGDEFTILLDDIRDPADATLVAGRVLEELSRPYQIDGHEIYSSASIGIALSHPGSESPEQLLRDADIAMYRAKEAGKAQSAVFDAQMHTLAMERLRLETELRRALDRPEEFRLHYQPIIANSTGEITGFEALVRWHTPDRGLIPPGDFIPIAEETGLIVPLGGIVLEKACRQLRAWNSVRQKDSLLTMSVNISASQLRQAGFPDMVESLLAKHEIARGCLALEVTESQLMSDAESLLRVLKRLKEIGVCLYVDDFGTGYSSLAYLRRFPVDVLKIDRSFVSGSQGGQGSPAIVRAVVDLGHSMKLTVVAEGVETGEQHQLIRDAGCDSSQGYLFSPPVPPDEIDRLLASRATW